MRLRAESLGPGRPLSRLLGVLLLLASFAALASSKEDFKPRITATTFPNIVDGLFYFDDSDVILVFEPHTRTVHRTDDAGVTWEAVDSGSKGNAVNLIPHRFDKKRAYILGPKDKHWYTNDRGESWHEFSSPGPALLEQPLRFHAGDPDKIIFQAYSCKTIIDCEEFIALTTDGFKTEPKKIRGHTRGCRFAHSTELMTTDHDAVDDDRIFCVVRGRNSPWRKDHRLVRSDNHFVEELEPDLDRGRTVQGLVSIATAQRFMVAAARSEGTDEMALFVTSDFENWHRAEFPADHKVVQGAYTLLESTSYSIQVDVMNTKPSSAMGMLYTSNSDGTHFTLNIEHTNRNMRGIVDFEKVSKIQGIVLVNTVDNWEEVEKYGASKKKVQSKISFDDGRTFRKLKVDKDDLHLHSVSELHNAGRVFSSPAPGLVMGIGNTGDHLKDYRKGDLYVSDDAGATWKLARKGAHKYEFGDQGSILVALADEDTTDEIAYSTDHGRTWDTEKLGQKVNGLVLTTVPDSTSLKFLVIGTKGKDLDSEFVLFSVDFGGLHERKCEKDDFEKWYAREEAEGEARCIMGQRQYYIRRKAEADCFINEEFDDPEVRIETCACSDADYECDFGFVKKGDKCELAEGSRPVLPAGACKSADDTYLSSSGYRLIAGNNCTKEDGVVKDKQKEWPCEGAVRPPSDGKISNALTTFDNTIAEWYYLERTATSSGDVDEETIVLRTVDQQIYISHDHGKEWIEVEALKGKHIGAIYPHRHINDRVFFIADSDKVYLSRDRGRTISHFKAPHKPRVDGKAPILSFHPHEKDWMIWSGREDCDGDDSRCQNVASISTEGGDDWDRKTMQRGVRKCEFISQDGNNSSQLIFCEQHRDEDPKKPLRLMASEDFFRKDQLTESIFDDLVDFKTMSEFVVVAAKAEDGEFLKVETSVDGKHFAVAHFPPGFVVPHQRVYTVLKGSQHSVSLHVTVNDAAGREYGSIIKSNSNGTLYTMSLSGVNRNSDGYVDYEMMEGLEGVAIVNVVSNVKEVQDGKAKLLKSMITHNDGGQWDYLTPLNDADGNKIDCAGDASCSLHLHGYTERADARDTFASRSAVGLMIAVGNIGANLEDKSKGNTFMTRDGGFTWNMIKEGQYTWEYGDQGSIIAIVDEAAPTDVVWYSLDEGQTWEQHQFHDEKVEVAEISTVPSDDSRRFLLWGKVGGKIVTISLDFSGLTQRQRLCTLDDNEPEAGDYDLWTPQHPNQKDNCLFGHKARYLRKKPKAQCYNGRKIQHVHDIKEDCDCTNYDYECDYNYERRNDGTCGLVPGYEPPDHSAICAEDAERKEWFEPTGYRLTPSSTCKGGLRLAEQRAHPCPGFEEDFEQRHGGRLSGFALFLVIVIPLALASAVGYWVWTHWDGKFGRIRLGDAGGAGTWDTDSPVVRYAVTAVAVVVAVAMAVPDVVTRAWRSLRGLFGSVGGGAQTYTSRGAFARQRDLYTVVDDDEGELLGDESDEEV
ncbi:MAG: hypothetical protein M1825_006126 [Sarcosagium campestre]|nr:MAG: hypothetical protein M1825_006126 [Sarcosagium campestre]